ncbi:MAG: hypothetical protein OXL96_01065 [Candidatus Poribacteria bacterium]|nr:hypothetical protein [Candidatus Poribacteria bacterium]
MTENTASAATEPETHLTQKQQKIREHRRRIRRAAHFFVHESKNVSTIAKAFNTTEQTIFEWSKTGLWRKVLHENRYTGAIRTPMWKEQLPEKIPYALTEKYLLTKAFIAEGDTARFVTYNGFKDVKIKKIHPYSYDLDDDSQIDKIEILLAFPKSRMEYLKKHIKRRADIAEYKLKAILKRSERPQIDTAAEVGDTIKGILRNGLSFTGFVIWNSRYNVVLRVGGTKEEGGKVVLLYKHGLHDFSIIKTGEKDA